ncbi:MAG: hypothetical protein AAF600_11370 [Bacteroidota bacterium]
MRYFLIAFLFVIVSVGCTVPEYLSEEDLYSFIQDGRNGLIKEKKIGKVMIKVFYRPNDFLVWQELEGESDTSKIKNALKRYDTYFYFMMQLSVGQKDALYGLSTNQMEFNDRLQTLSFRMNQFVNLTTSDQDTIPVADFYYSRMFGFSKTNDLLFVFNNEQIGDSEWISLNTKEFGFKTGRQSFRFDVGNIESAPRLEELFQLKKLYNVKY